MKTRADSTLIALRRVLRALDTNARAIARASGLTHAQMLVLHALSEAGQEMPRDIARRLGVSQATVSTLIDRMEARGLVRRARRAADRRMVWVILTDEGRRVLDAAPDPLHDMFIRRFEALPDWEQAMLMATTERLGHLFDAATMEPLPEPVDAPLRGDLSA